MTGVHDVAAAVLARTGETTTMKMQKLVYYCQAWHLARHGRQMFPEEIQAWRDGPVVKSLYDAHRGARVVSRWSRGDARNLDVDELETVNWVVSRYGEIDADYLSRMTHTDAPWYTARDGVPDNAPSSSPISIDLMRNCYVRLLIDPEAAVRHATANAALEGVELNESQRAALLSVARGERSADDLVAEWVAQAQRG